MDRPLRVGCVFSGIAGLELGFVQEGCEVAFQIEIDAACRSILRRHWPDVRQYDDVREVTYDRLRADLGERADVDVLIGGWPCQDISLAGRRAGLAGARSGLFFEFARLAAEIAPRWLVAENVPGLLSSWSPVEPPPSDLPAGQGNWQVDETHDLGIVVATLAELGYVGAWRCLDAQHFGVPQRRRRIFFVCHLGAPFSAPAQVLFEPDCGTGHPSAGDEAGEDDAEGAGDGPDALGPEGWTPDVALPLLSNRQGGQRTTDVEGVTFVAQPVFVGSEYGEELARPITAVEHGPRYDMETENLLVDPRPYGEPPFAVSMRGRAEGNVPEVEESGVVPALRTGEGGSGNPMVVVDEVVEIVDDEPQPIYSVHNGDDAIWAENIAQPVIGSKGWPGAVTYVPEAAPLTAGTAASPGVNPPGRRQEDDVNVVVFRKSQRAHTPDDGETWVEDGVANTLNGFENHNDMRTTHVVVEPVPVELRMATRTSGKRGAGTPGTGFGKEGDPSYPVMTSPPPAVQQQLSVRRLTPLECERLMGFVDGWTDGQSDSVRYKQLGNSVAVVVSRWIARRLVAVHAAL